MVIRSMSWSVLKKNRGLLSLFAIIGTGGMCSILYLMRLATKAPDVAIIGRNKNPEPWQAYENKQYKFYKSPIEKKYIQIEERPKF